MQETTRWKLGTVDFTRYFHYKFENENGLLAPVLSIPKPFDEPYEFTFDTTSYPWTLNLIRPSDDVKAEIRWGKDMISFDEVSDPTEIVNYIIPKGYGEGVNQLTIESVNGGLKYLKDQASIDEWGKHSYIWIDRRFEDAESLMANGQSLLNQWKEPKIAFTCKNTDLSVLPEYEHEQKYLNDVTKIVVEDKTYQARIIGEKIADISKEHEVDYEIANKLDDIATTQADLERKQRVNDAYSMGATNIDSHNYEDNCDPDNPAIVKFYLPNDLVNINTMTLSYEVDSFRAYSQATEGGGANTVTSASGGSTTVTSESGGGSSTTSAAGGNHSHEMFRLYDSTPRDMTGQEGFGYYSKDSVGNQIGGYLTIDPFGASGLYTFGASGDHSHSVSIPLHSHSVSIPSHTHDLTLPDHTHDVKHGIYRLATLPNSVTIKVDGAAIPGMNLNGQDIDIIPYLSKDSGGKVQRGTWHTVEVIPDNLARVTVNVVSRLFIQSRLGGTF
jgi:phage minor structural protein